MCEFSTNTHIWRISTSSKLFLRYLDVKYTTNIVLSILKFTTSYFSISIYKMIVHLQQLLDILAKYLITIITFPFQNWHLTIVLLKNIALFDDPFFGENRNTKTLWENMAMLVYDFSLNIQRRNHFPFEVLSFVDFERTQTQFPHSQYTGIYYMNTWCWILLIQRYTIKK